MFSNAVCISKCFKILHSCRSFIRSLLLFYNISICWKSSLHRWNISLNNFLFFEFCAFFHSARFFYSICFSHSFFCFVQFTLTAFLLFRFLFSLSFLFCVQMLFLILLLHPFSSVRSVRFAGWDRVPVFYYAIISWVGNKFERLMQTFQHIYTVQRIHSHSCLFWPLEWDEMFALSWKCIRNFCSRAEIFIHLLVVSSTN